MDAVNDEQHERGCLMLAIGAFIAMAWAFGTAWHFWGFK
jgi:hypothetical protein